MKLLVLLVCVGVAVAHKPYIIGGNNVTVPGKWPHQGDIRLRDIVQFCGISLISPTWGVTEAYHLEGASPSDLTVQFGSNDKTQGGQVVNVKQIIMHEDFGKGTSVFPNNIAVVEFTEAVTAEYAAPIPMADGSTDPAGNEDCWITGWGLTDSPGHGVFPDILQEAKINVYTNAECMGDWGSRINAGNICVGDKTLGRGICIGDTGSPAVCKINGRYELVGAGSWHDCSRGLYPAVYTRIGYFREWIRGKTGV